MFPQTFRLIKSSPQSFSLETTSITFVHEQNIYRVQLCTAQHRNILYSIDTLA